MTVFINPRTNKPYPIPTRSAIERAKAHLSMASALTRLYEQAAGSNTTFLTVVLAEKARQDRMVHQFREHYGSNAHI